MLQLRQWARLSFDGRERVVGLDFNISELKESLVRDGLASLVNGCLTLTGVDEEDFFGLNNLFHFVELVVNWRVRLTFRQTCKGTSCFVGHFYFLNVKFSGKVICKNM